ncbi:MAG TPA: bestrophin family ion channel [Nitrospirales bacterium]|nr:hypothetical protein [Nitrospiraceae bacterium]HNP30530.1 bestrophin family ion channel [Nitrospirales bacterium]
MIVRRTLPFKWFLQIDGWAVLFYTLYGYGICTLHLEFFFEKLAFPFTGMSVFGTAVAILLAFRNNSAYERYWEARITWGELTNYSRNFASQVLVYIQPPQGSDAQPGQVEELHREFIYRHLAFLVALRLQLREGYASNALSSFITKAELVRLEAVANRATQLNHWQAKRLQEVFDAGWIAPRAYVMGLMESLKDFYIAQGKCERIKNTPLPRQYGFFTKIFVWTFLLLLPFSLVQHLGWETLPIYVMLAFMFTVMERVGSRTEDPFDGKNEDVPMIAICRTIEIDLRQQLGETSVPPKIEPIEGVLM